MEPDPPTIPRYLLIQAILAVAIGLAVGLALLMADTGGLRGLLQARPQDTLIFFIGSVTTLCPLVLATAVAILPYDRQWRRGP